METLETLLEQVHEYVTGSHILMETYSVSSPYYEYDKYAHFVDQVESITSSRALQEAVISGYCALYESRLSEALLSKVSKGVQLGIKLRRKMLENPNDGELVRKCKRALQNIEGELVNIKDHMKKTPISQHAANLARVGFMVFGLMNAGDGMASTIHKGDVSINVETGVANVNGHNIDYLHTHNGIPTIDNQNSHESHSSEGSHEIDPKLSHDSAGHYTYDMSQGEKSEATKAVHKPAPVSEHKVAQHIKDKYSDQLVGMTVDDMCESENKEIARLGKILEKHYGEGEYTDISGGWDLNHKFSDKAVSNPEKYNELHADFMKHTAHTNEHLKETERENLSDAAVFHKMTGSDGSKAMHRGFFDACERLDTNASDFIDAVKNGEMSADTAAKIIRQSLVNTFDGNEGIADRFISNNGEITRGEMIKLGASEELLSNLKFDGDENYDSLVSTDGNENGDKYHSDHRKTTQHERGEQAWAADAATDTEHKYHAEKEEDTISYKISHQGAEEDDDDDESSSS